MRSGTDDKTDHDFHVGAFYFESRLGLGTRVCLLGRTLSNPRSDHIRDVDRHRRVSCHPIKNVNATPYFVTL